MSKPKTQAGRKAVDAIKSGALGMWADDADDPIAAMIAAVEDEASSFDIKILARALALNEFDDPNDAFNAEGESYPSDIQWAEEIAHIYAKELRKSK